MEVFGLLGFIFGLSAMSMAGTANGKIKDLEGRLQTLESEHREARDSAIKE